MAFLRRDTFTGVSIHAPARGATAPPLKAEQNMSFNPRAREGRDVNALGCAYLVIVSIHAPARGATRDRRAASQTR